ncbi:MAG TPA: type II secretion system protein [Candidatus Paceibacterota bacterium]|nr:type II secretion system protein [Candidatus Paceibacterota bacterium]
MNNRERGFTLIELLVVIAIIGILSSVVLASLNSARQKGRDARRISDLKQLQLALELYYDANSSAYPVQTTAVAVSETTLGGLTPDYISTIPDDPVTGKDYFYISAAAGASYCLGADLEGSSGQADSCPTLDPANGTDYHVGP